MDWAESFCFGIYLGKSVQKKWILAGVLIDMCEYMPISEVVKLPINWVRGDDKRLETVFKSLKNHGEFREPIKLLNCGCGKSYMLEDGGHRITAAHKLYKKTGKDTKVRVHLYTANFD